MDIPKSAKQYLAGEVKRLALMWLGDHISSNREAFDAFADAAAEKAWVEVWRTTSAYAKDEAYKQGYLAGLENTRQEGGEMNIEGRITAIGELKWKWSPAEGITHDITVTFEARGINGQENALYALTLGEAVLTQDKPDVRTRDWKPKLNDDVGQTPRNSSGFTSNPG